MMDNIAPPGLNDLNPVMDRLLSEKAKSLNLGNNKKKEMEKDFFVFRRGN